VLPEKKISTHNEKKDRQAGFLWGKLLKGDKKIQHKLDGGKERRS